jgi:hypothetical protein
MTSGLSLFCSLSVVDDSDQPVAVLSDVEDHTPST